MSGTPAPAVHHEIAGLFAGIGGLELGLHRAGHRTTLLCESNPGATAVLKTHFPDVDYHDDITTLTRLPKGTTLVAAGFPCQDLSQAGQTAGIGGLRSGLVDEVFRLVRQERTPWLLLENVPFMLQLNRGRAMEHITGALEALGYHWAYRVVDSRALGRPQRRRRVYLLASLIGDPRSVLFADEAGPVAEVKINESRTACGFYWTEGIRGLGWAVDAIPTLKGGSTLGIPSPPAILLPDGAVVTPHLRDAERLQGFPSDWTQPAETVGRSGPRWRLVGNAVSVPAAEWIGRRMTNPGPVLEFPITPLSSAPWPTAAWNVGQGRMAVAASEWPVRQPYQPLAAFLKHPPRLLSLKATRGFLERAGRSQLIFPAGFLDALRAHELRMASSGELPKERISARAPSAIQES